MKRRQSAVVLVPKKFVIRLVLSTIVALVLVALVVLPPRLSFHIQNFLLDNHNNNGSARVMIKTTMYSLSSSSKVNQLRQKSRKQQDDFCQHMFETDNSNSNTSTTTTTATRKNTAKPKRITVHGFQHNNNNSNITFDMYVYEQRDSVSKQIMFSGKWDPTKLDLLRHAIQAYSLQYNIPLANLTFVDIGANIGWFTFQLVASLGIQVLAIEPMHHNVQLMRRTLCLNPQWADRITLLQTGLSSYNHTCVLFSDMFNVGDGHLDCNVPDPTKFVPPAHYHIQGIIPSQRIDDILYHGNAYDEYDDTNDDPLLHIAAVKMDVEAHEPQVVLGGPRFFGNSGIPFFMVEFIPKMIQRQHSDAVGMLRTFCQANCTIRPELASRPWSCTEEALDPITWKEESIMDLIIECPSNKKK